MNDKDTEPFEDTAPSIHTLESDLASVALDKDYGKNIVKIITDPDKNSTFPKVLAIPEKKQSIFLNKKSIFIIFFIIFVITSAGTIIYILHKANNVTESTINKDIPARVENISTTTKILPVVLNTNFLNPEILQSFDFSNSNRDQFALGLYKIKDNLTAQKIQPNNNIGINMNLTITQLFEKIRYSGNDSLLRSLDNVYAFGLYSRKEGGFENYTLIKVNNFDLAFKSMLDWEAYIPTDLKGIYIGNNEITNNTVNNVSRSTLSTSTENSSTTVSTTSVVNNKKYYKKNTVGFIDRTLKNYDIREYVSNENNSDIIYGFINNQFLLITSGEESFLDIKDRLLKENIVR
jgi:hypothetical protein